MSRREFQLIEGTASKFWSITLEGLTHTVNFGRIGTSGQSTRKEFATESEAKASHDKLIAEKVKKGYSEVEGGGATATAVAPAPSATRSKPAAKPKKEPKATEPTPEPEPEPEPKPKPEPVSEAASAAQAVAASTPVLVAERSIELNPEDWFWDASWLVAPLPRPAPKPYDFEKALARLAKVANSTTSYQWNWSKIAFSPAMSREEAQFWLSAMADLPWTCNPKEYLARLESEHRDGGREQTPAGVFKLLEGRGRCSPSEVVIPFMNLFTLDDLYALMSRPLGSARYDISDGNHRLLDGFRRYVLPYLSRDEVQSLRDRVRADFDPSAFPADFYSAFPTPWYLSAVLGLHDEVADLVRAIPDDTYSGGESWKDHYHRPQALVLGLGDPKRIEAEWRRLKLTHKRPEEVRGWIATTGWAALDVVRDSILAATAKDECGQLMEELAKVKAPEAAPIMLELMFGSKAPKLARRWLDENPGHAIAGLIPTAAGRGKLADAALEFLRDQKKKGHADFIRECLATASPEAAEKIRREVLDRYTVVVPYLDDATTPEPIREAMAAATKWNVPGWVSLDDLPQVLVADRSLTEEQRQALLAALAKSTLAAPHPLVVAIKAHATRASLDAFAWALFERWQVEGAPSKEKWAMLALGLIGSDASALRLTPLVRAWPGESQHQRAVTGLECLRAIGSDVAMMQLNGIAQKLPFKGLKAKAAEMMEAIAADRNLTRAQLEDRIVPDCDLDERGSRVFDFGPRQFRFVLGNEMKPMVRDPEDKLKTDLPKPGAKDDSALASASVEAWKLLKKQVKEVAKVQAERLEQAMVTGRRWSPADFETLLVRHPLMTNLVRLVLWGGYDESGKLIRTFRVTEERDYADANESTASLEGLAKMGVVHPLHLPDAERSAWGEIFGDYEIIPPFAQLGRPVHRLEPEEQDAKELVRNQGLKVPAITLVGILDRHGWARGVPQDAGIFCEHSKAFEGADVTAVIQYDGIPIGGMIEWDDQEITRCCFVPGIYTPQMYPDHRKAITLGRVDPVVISEVIGTLGAVAAKAK